MAPLPRVRRARRGAAGRACSCAARCATDPGDEVAAAYDAPFPSEASKAGARAFPAILPLAPDDPGAEAGRRTLAALREDTRPALILWGDADPVLPVRAGEALASALGKPAPRVIEGAGHFLQEDQGALVGALIADWLRLRLGGACAPGRAGPRPPCRRSGRSRRRATRRRRAWTGRPRRDLVGLHHVRERLAGAARQDRGELQQRPGRARDEHVEARDLERADDLAGDLLAA